MNLQIRLVSNKKGLNQVINIRKAVFVQEQKVPINIEMDEHDNESEHFIAIMEGKPVGCARVRTFENYIKLERIAVLKEHRGNGFGKQITNFLIKYYKKKNIDEIRLHSQISVADFYTKLGFKKRGEIFSEADIEHIQMYIKN